MHQRHRSSHGLGRCTPCGTLPVARRPVCSRLRAATPSAAKKDLQADVVVVGGGIIGLLTAQALLKSKLSVAVVEKASLCAGATGAGQGYIWMSHRTADTASWQLAAASTARWKHMVQQDPSFASAIEWQDTGSLLLASTADEARLLSERVTMLKSHGVSAQLLSSEQVTAQEPALSLPQDGCGLLVASDAQINGRKTAAVLLESCRQHGAMFQDLMQEQVEHVYCTDGAPAVATEHYRVRSRLATVVAAGVWSGQLLAAATRDPVWKTALVPRRGHLCEAPRPSHMPPLRLGVMEMSYTKHYTSAGSHGSASTSRQHPSTDITFTATTSASGSLLIGSSREVDQMDKVVQPDVVAAIMQRAAEFLPALHECVPPSGDAVRVGPRPYAVGGLPFIGPVPGQRGLFVAAGHEGSGLCLGPATADLVVQYVTQERSSIPHWADEFKPEVRLLLAGL